MRWHWVLGMALGCACSTTEDRSPAEGGMGGSGDVETEGGQPGTGGQPGMGGGFNCGGAMSLCRMDEGVRTTVRLGGSRAEASTRVVTACRGQKCVDASGATFFGGRGEVWSDPENAPSATVTEVPGVGVVLQIGWYPTPSEVAALPDGEEFSVRVSEASGALVVARRAHATFRLEIRGSSSPGCGGPETCVVATLEELPPPDGGVPSVDGGPSEGGAPPDGGARDSGRD